MKLDNLEPRRESCKMRLDSFDAKADAIKYIQNCLKEGASYEEANSYLRKHIPSESIYQAKLLAFLNSAYPQGFAWKLAAGPYTRQGIPDIGFILYGRYFGFEVKRPFFGKTSTIQEQTIKKIRAAGGVAEVISFPWEAKEIIDKTFQTDGEEDG